MGQAAEDMGKSIFENFGRPAIKNIKKNPKNARM